MSLVIPMVIYMQQHLAQQADKQLAVHMQASQRGRQACYGVTDTQRAAIFADARSHTVIDTQDNYHRLLLWLWSGVYQEERELALDAGAYYQRFINASAFSTYIEMLATVDNNVMADRLAETLISPVIKQHREYETTLKTWQTSDSKWHKRAALLAHWGHYHDTHTALLTDTILQLADDPDSDVQQAIGLILRHYSETDFAFVDHFIKTYFDRLQPQARREARKVPMIISIA